MMTFEELKDKMTLPGIFAGTDVDEATQIMLLDEYFDEYLSQDENLFLRNFRKRCNRFYPIYKDMVRVATVSNNMDPFIINYMQERTRSAGEINGNDQYEKTGTNTGNETSTGTDNRSSIRTPDLETNIITTDTGSQITSGSSSSTRTPNLTETTSKTGEDSVENNTETSDNTRDQGISTSNDTDNFEGNEKNRTFSVAYPEANMNSFPSSIDDNPNIDYVSGEAVSLRKATNTDNKTSSGTTDNTITKNVSVEYDGTTTYNTTETSKSTGTDTVSGNSSSNITENNSGTSKTEQSGTETISENGTHETTISNNKEMTENQNKTTNLNLNNETKVETQGRNESVADILPRAIKAIQKTDCIGYLIKMLEPCFDLYVF